MKWEDARELAIRQLLKKNKSNSDEAIERVVSEMRLEITSPNNEMSYLFRRAGEAIKTAKKQLTAERKKAGKGSPIRQF